MHDTVKMPLTVSLMLDEMVNALLYKEVEVDGKKTAVERALPFRLKYRLNRNKATLDKDYKAYEQKSLYLMAKYGELTKDGIHLAITDPEKKKAYTNEMTAALSTVVEHTVVKLSPEDFDEVNDTDLHFSPEMMKILLGYLVDDDAYFEDITSDIVFNDYVPDPEEPKTFRLENVAEMLDKTQQEEAPKKARRPRAKKEEVKVEESKKTSEKTTSKKTSTKKTTKKENKK